MRRIAPAAWLFMASTFSAWTLDGCGKVAGQPIVAELSGGAPNSSQGGSGGVESGGSGGAATSGGSASGGAGGTTGDAGGSTTNEAGQTCTDAPLGFSTVGGMPTTGGDGGKRVSAMTADDLKADATSTDTLIIEIPVEITLSEQIRPQPNKTFLGIGSSGALTGGGIYMIDTQNIIVKNLKISKVPKDVGDALTIQSSQRVWVDHCDLSSDRNAPKGTYDGLLDITHGSDWITVSWNYFHDHLDTSIVGHSVDNGAEDSGHLTVTYHHNWFSNVDADTPRVRFGTVHVFNNFFDNITGTAVISQMSANVYVDDNYFTASVPAPLVTVYEDPTPGNATDSNNVFQGGRPNITSPSQWVPSDTFGTTIQPDTPGAEQFYVPHCAGVGKLP